MAALEMQCVLRYDPETGVVSCETKNWERLLMIKLQSPEKETMLRAMKARDGERDCDNFWLGVKPGDAEVIELFGRKQLIVKDIDWEIV